MAEKRLHQQVAEKIRELIVSGAYPPGTRLPGERELAERFGVSRVVVREAEISLEALGFVQIKVGSGVYITEPNLASGAFLPKVSAFELTQSRLLFESESAALAARVITDEQLDELQKTIERMAAPRNGVDDGEDADKDFHLLIARASGNATNAFLMEQLWRIRTEVDEVQQVYAAICGKDTPHRVEEHTMILDALRARDPEGARVAMKHHFARLLEALLEASEKQAIEAARAASHMNRERFLKAALS